jgi:hypothetical protein
MQCERIWLVYLSTLPGTIVHFLLPELDLLFFPFFTEPSNGPLTLLGMHMTNILLFSRYFVFGTALSIFIQVAKAGDLS